jgi:lipopolysaccharide transport system permease protein
MTDKHIQWQWEIKAKPGWLGTGFKELFAYKDLLFRLVRKEFLLRYQQTLLGPVWVIIQPLLTVLIYVIVFRKVIGISTDGIPPFLFYLTGITLWTLFSDIFAGTASTFVQNIEVFNKVYFPRLIAPLSVVLLHCVRFLIQLSLLLILQLYFYFTGDIELHFINYLFCLPVILMIAGFGLGGGLIFSIITAKYKDLANVLHIFISLLMFICPVFYSLAIVPKNIQWLVNLNPLSVLFELFRFSFLGKGQFSAFQIVYSISIMLVILTGGLLLFNKKGDELIDVV